jgi:hypothetical protein
MKTFTILLCSLALLFGPVAFAAALPVDGLYFAVDGDKSEVPITNVRTLGWTSLDASLADALTGPDPLDFYLDVGKTQTINYFSLTASGTGVGSADITATLAFEQPQIAASGDGDLGWATAFGRILGGFSY